eukprot:scaffold3.g6483.t1
MCCDLAAQQLGLKAEPVLRSLAVRGYAQIVDGLKYAKSHEWTKNELGDVVYVELPEVGSEVTKGETFGVVESVKAASDIYSPISGEVVEANAEVVNDPSKARRLLLFILLGRGYVNSDPFGSGWLIKVKLADSGELDSLLDSTAYKAHVDAGGH